jgi:cytochrome c oxidase assembly protein subunit 15
MNVAGSPASRGFHRLSLATLFIGALLVWWGAATTTDHAGMAFSGWPLSNGSLNPEGWLHITPWMLEHGHRLLATAVGLLVLVMFIWQWLRNRQPWYEVPLLAGAIAMIISAASQMTWWLVAVIGLSMMAWLAWGLTSRGWSPVLKLSSAAIITVVTQGVLGGMRVLKISDPYGIAHGCLGQLFYCLLIALAFVAAPKWGSNPMLVPAKMRNGLIKLSTLLLLAVFMQLVIGAVIRHTHRFDLAANDVFTTGGDLVPFGRSFDLVALFAHKAWALVVFTIAAMTSIVTWRLLMRQGAFRALPILLVALPIAQITLGVYVILTAKSFWVTNFHVINGLGILATSFILAMQVRCSVTENDL